jgi:hypothetical protein
MRVSGFSVKNEFVLVAGAKAKTLSDWRQPGRRDKLIYFIGRVMRSSLFFW